MQRWGLAIVLALAIGAIAFATVRYDHFAGVAGIPLVAALAVAIAKPALGGKVAMVAGAIGLVISIGYMVWAGMHRDEIADPHAATRGVQIALAVCGLALLTGRANATKQQPSTIQQLAAAQPSDSPHKMTDAMQLFKSTDPIPKPEVKS